MPEIPKELFDHITETNKTLGRIEANQENHSNRLDAIHADLKTHVGDNGAHGVGTQEAQQKKADRSLNKWLTAVIAGVPFLELIWRVFHKSPKVP